MKKKNKKIESHGFFVEKIKYRKPSKKWRPTVKFLESAVLTVDPKTKTTKSKNTYITAKNEEEEQEMIKSRNEESVDFVESLLAIHEKNKQNNDK